MPRPRKFDESDVIAAAREEFWTRGYGATSVDDLTTATGLGKGSLYGAFKDKRHLFLRALADYNERVLSDMRSALVDSEGSPWRRLEDFMFTTIVDQGLRGCLMANSVSELTNQDPELLDRSRAFYAAQEDTLTLCLDQARERGEIADGANPREQARLLLATIQGIRFLQQAGMAGSQIRQIARSALDAVPKATNPVAGVTRGAPTSG
ncbi:MAG: TetR/AcrR family transcriptional regulator [Stackebrandtia sp.]